MIRAPWPTDSEAHGELALVGDDEPAGREAQPVHVQVDGVVRLAVELDDGAAGQRDRAPRGHRARPSSAQTRTSTSSMASRSGCLEVVGRIDLQRVLQEGEEGARHEVHEAAVQRRRTRSRPSGLALLGHRGVERLLGVDDGDSGAAISTLWRSTDPVAVEAEDMTWFIASPMADSSISDEVGVAVLAASVCARHGRREAAGAVTGMDSTLPPLMPST